jgi:hypothetical protein
MPTRFGSGAASVSMHARSLENCLSEKSYLFLDGARPESVNFDEFGRDSQNLETS